MMKQSDAILFENFSTRSWSLMALGSCCVFVASLSNNNVYLSEPDPAAVNSTESKAFITEFGLVFPEIDDTDTEEYLIESGIRFVSVEQVKKDARERLFPDVYFPDQKNSRLTIKTGNAVLRQGLNDINEEGTDDLVEIDDFFYNEPQLQ